MQHNKHIPHAYKTAPLGDRLALLAGLMDTDAHLTKTGCFVISQVRKRLADDIAFVARSCGFRVTQTEDTINGTIYHRSFISGATSQIPTRLQRKQAAPRRQVKEINRWGVTVEALGIGDYCGFELEGPDRLFLLGDFTVTHNTTIAIYTQAFQTYLLSAASHPHKDLDLDPSSEILTVFQSLSKNLAADVDYRRFRDMIANAPYFAEYFPFNKDRESELSFPRRIIVKPVAGHDQAAIGQNVIGGILDEINFMAVVEKSKMTMDSSIYDQAMSNYNAIASRRASRFAILGEVPGMLCLVSSRNYPGQFTDQKEKEAKTNKRIYVYDMVLWKLRPKRFAGTTFRVFVGDATRRPRIMPDDEQISDEDRRLVQDVPTEYKDNFSRDILVALREVAGVSTIAMHPFIPDTTAIAECFLPNQFSILSRTECDFADTRPLIYPKRFLNPSYPRFVHGDIALSGDNYGLAIGHVPGFKEVKRSDTVTEMMPIIYYDALLRIQAPRGGEIELENPRRLLYALRENGLNIKWVTFDSYQSSDSIQLLRQRNFVVGLQSMDEKPTPYSITKQAFYDRRIRAHPHERAQTELAQLEQDQKTRKIDHSPHGSKDVSDAMAGVCYGLTMRRDIWRMFNIPLRQIPRSIVEAENDGKMSLAADEKRDIRFGGRRGYEEIAVG